MKFLFVSRSTMDEAVTVREKRIEELKAELATAQKEVKILHNQMAWRMSGIPIDPDLLPEQYRGKTAPVKSETKSEGLKVVPGGPKGLRAMISEQEKKREQEFLESQGRSVERHEVPPAQLEIAKNLADTVRQAETENKGA